MEYHHKTKQDLIAYLTAKGQPIDGKGAFICPYCQSGAKNHKTSGFSLFQDNKTGKGRYKCFACGENGDFYDLYHHFTGNSGGDYPQITVKPQNYSETQSLDTKYQIKSEVLSIDEINAFNRLLCEFSEIKAFQFDEYHHLTAKNKYFTLSSATNAILYLSRRGIDMPLIRRFQIGFNFDALKNPYIVLPCFDISGSLKGFQKRYFEPETVERMGKQRHPKGQRGLVIWNGKAFQNQKPILIFEGIIDALTAYQVKEFSDFNAIAINSVSNIRHFIAFLRQHKPKNKLFACFDNDNAGNQATAAIKQTFSGIETLNEFYSGFKDLNDFFKNKLIRMGA